MNGNAPLSPRPLVIAYGGRHTVSMNGATATKTTAAEVRKGDMIARKQAGEFERVAFIETIDMPPRCRFWFGKQRIGSMRPGERSMLVRREGAVWRQGEA